ncbi:MAG TPA: hypothetical protein VEH81_15570 [Ktedonobacteraceae bacterium]|nr:hypothetical protein [Ktedonobacteraceae bacterium]
MSLEDNKAIVRRVYEEVWNRGNVAAFDELIAPTLITLHSHYSRTCGKPQEAERMEELS